MWKFKGPKIAKIISEKKKRLIVKLQQSRQYGIVEKIDL